MRVAMTGGGGFIGSHLLARLVGAGIDVTIIGPTVGKSRYTASLVAAGDVRFLRCDLIFEQETVLRPALMDADVLVLLGYVVPRFAGKTRRLLDEINFNVAPLVRLLSAAEGRSHHVVFASSTAVYGTPSHVPVRECDALAPDTPYAIAKIACEETVQLIALAAGWTACVLRYSTVYGAGETVPRAIPNFIRAALGGRPPVVDGDGLDERDYIHVSDVAAATMAAIRHSGSGIYNIGTGKGMTTLDVARLVFDLAGSKASVFHRSIAQPDRAISRLICDTTVAREQLGFAASRKLEDGIAEEIGWFRALPSTTSNRDSMSRGALAANVAVLG